MWLIGGTGRACLEGHGHRGSAWQIGVALTLVGVFAAIYHPVGLALVVQGRSKTGMPLAINGVCGNLGVACAALLSGFPNGEGNLFAEHRQLGEFFCACLTLDAHVDSNFAEAFAHIVSKAQEASDIHVARV